MASGAFGERFDLKKLFFAREVARDIAYELSSLLRPGMSEEDAHQMYRELCKKYPVEKQWHPPKLRMGPNTVKNFREPSDPYCLQEEDIYFIDIGPVIEGHEADYGETFVMGNNFEHKLIQSASTKIFQEVAAHWKRTRATGGPLYEYAKKLAQDLGYHLNLDSNGHRIGDFPHHVHFKGSLPEYENELVPNAWILEIHLWHPEKKFGAFFEDILTED